MRDTEENTGGERDTEDNTGGERDTEDNTGGERDTEDNTGGERDTEDNILFSWRHPEFYIIYRLPHISKQRVKMFTQN